MIRCSHFMAVGMLICLLTPSAWAATYMYTPQPVTPGDSAPSSEGVLVKEVEVNRGDTLYGLSRRFSGHGSYYPQILLFNKIDDPNLIYAGTTIKIPADPAAGATADRPSQSTAKPLSQQKRVSKLRTKRAAVAAGSTGISHPARSTSARKRNMKPADEVARAAAISSKAHGNSSGKSADTVAVHPQREASTAPASPSAKDRQMFEKAVTAYRHDDCRTALELFDRYLAANPASPLAADASLYKADCYLKLAAQ